MGCAKRFAVCIIIAISCSLFVEGMVYHGAEDHKHVRVLVYNSKNMETNAINGELTRNFADDKLMSENDWNRFDKDRSGAVATLNDADDIFEDGEEAIAEPEPIISLLDDSENLESERMLLILSGRKQSQNSIPYNMPPIRMKRRSQKASSLYPERTFDSKKGTNQLFASTTEDWTQENGTVDSESSSGAETKSTNRVTKPKQLSSESDKNGKINETETTPALYVSGEPVDEGETYPEGEKSDDPENEPEKEPDGESENEPEKEPGNDGGSKTEPSESFAEPGPDWDLAKSTWKGAWGFHIYFFGISFTLLGIYCVANVVRLFQKDHLLSRHYFLSLNMLVITVCALRAVYLLVDAYNSTNTFPIFVDYFLYNTVFPCLSAVFSILFYALLLATRIRIISAKIQRLWVLLAIISGHFVLSIATDIIVGLFATAFVLILICQCVFIAWGIIMFAGYLVVYRRLHKSVVLRQNSLHSPVPGRKVTLRTHVGRKQKYALGLAIRITLMSAIFGVGIVAFELYGMLGVYSVTKKGEKPKPWPWWSYHFCVRSLELLMCTGVAYVASQPLKYMKRRYSYIVSKYILCGACVEKCGAEHSQSESTPDNVSEGDQRSWGRTINRTNASDPSNSDESDKYFYYNKNDTLPLHKVKHTNKSVILEEELEEIPRISDVLSSSRSNHCPVRRSISEDMTSSKYEFANNDNVKDTGKVYNDSCESLPTNFCAVSVNCINIKDNVDGPCFSTVISVKDGANCKFIPGCDVYMVDAGLTDVKSQTGKLEPNANAKSVRGHLHNGHLNSKCYSNEHDINVYNVDSTSGKFLEDYRKARCRLNMRTRYNKSASLEDICSRESDSRKSQGSTLLQFPFRRCQSEYDNDNDKKQACPGLLTQS